MFIAEPGLLAFADYELDSLRIGVIAGSPCPVEVVRKVIKNICMPGVSICHEMAKTSSASTQARMDDLLVRCMGTVGRLVPHQEITVVDPVIDETVTHSVSGEFCT
ncbi:AMP-binding protein [Mycobacterium uberis]|uniref:AMP-binding protein n=1 Tax=Mycobacterium uberis TaxID=2162698 RepID=UPI001FB548EC|nr:AMP-binding protein [Mycobacterium uberis]